MYNIDVKILDKISNKKVIIIGDVMLDHYVYGSVDRISPEAPVPVVYVDKEEYKLGGAGNVASNIKALNGVSKLIGVAGKDQYADTIKKLLLDNEIDFQILDDNDRPTTIKSRIIAQDQQVVRVDREDSSAIDQGTLDVVISELRHNLTGGEVVIISDYGKGVICDKLLKSLQEIIAEKDIKVLVDPKILNCSLYQNAYLLTPNLKEAGECVGAVIKTKDEIINYGKLLKKNLNLDNLLITLGANGMALFSDKIYHVPAFAQKVYDVTGAGDTVISTIAVLLSSGVSLLDACIVANFAASQVVMEIGAAVPDYKGLVQTIKDNKGVELSVWG